jgi:hypothetical protein
MTSQSVDIFSMLNKAQSDYNQQQNSVAAFFRQAGSNNPNNNNNVARSMPMPISSLPPMQNLNSLEQIERQIRTSPPSNRKCGAGICWIFADIFAVTEDSQNNNNGNGLQPSQRGNNLANSPLAQFFNSNNFQNAPRPDVKAPPKENKPMNGQQPKVGAPPGFRTQQKKETKLITPTMLAAPSEKKPPATAEPLTKNQLLQALNYLIENDDDFMLKVHQAYIKSFKGLSS